MALVTGGSPARAAPVISLETPIGFFTNVAARLLSSELGLDLYRLQLYPTNQYTPAVHRLLQVSANLYDASTNRQQAEYPFLPSVFRPLFTNDRGAILICGYTEITNVALAPPGVPASFRDLTSSSDRAAWQTWDMAYGVPLVIGAKKGWPNFNQFAMQTRLQLTRKLRFTRDPGVWWPSGTNQLFTLSISNSLGVEAWNSYTNAFPRALQVSLAVDVLGVLSNDQGQALLNSSNTYLSCSLLGSNSWPGMTPTYALPSGSFLVPLLTNCCLLPPSAYSPASGGLTPIPGGWSDSLFENSSSLAAPRLWWSARTRLRFSIVEPAANRIVDYVNLDSLQDPTQAPIELMYTLMGSGSYPGTARYYPDGSDAGEWATNQIQTRPLSPSWGIENQIRVCLGNDFGGGGIYPGSWSNFCPSSLDASARQFAQHAFNDQFGFGAPGGTLVLSNFFYSPFDPVGTICLNTSWQVNDPLVHSQVSDLVEWFDSPYSHLTLNSPSSWPMSALGYKRLQRPLSALGP